MCGIFGIAVQSRSGLSLSETGQVIQRLFKLSEMRGKESAGIAIKNLHLRQISVLKKSLPASRLIKTSDYKDFFAQSLQGIFGEGKLSRLVAAPFALVAHARLVTNGTQDLADNNQPVIKDGLVLVHNGIVVNVDDLWRKFGFLRRDFEVDSEILAALIRHYLNTGKSIPEATAHTFREIQGAASIAVLLEDYDQVLIATNTGSLYLATNKPKNLSIFASERFILSALLRKNHFGGGFDEEEITWIQPGTGCLLDLNQFSVAHFPFEPGCFGTSGIGRKAEKDSILNCCAMIESPSPLNRSNQTSLPDRAKRERALLDWNTEAIERLKRCSRCILPESFPFISFDDEGVCNYCRNYKKMDLQGLEALKKEVEPFRSRNGKPDCLVAFSGGRDSSYGLHIAKNELGLIPIAYTYDWGMVTDLGRRNQARLCGRAGIEHIIISADIEKKRENIRKNVLAWLKRPHPGTVPLFMAGDKQYFYYANRLRKMNHLDLVILCENRLETTYFKSGFCGVQPNFGGPHTYTLSFLDKMKMAAFYGKEYAGNPAYLNSSLLDTVGAFLSYYAISHSYLNIYNYIPWNEEVIQSTLSREYEWEESSDTVTTWRIGDGTAAFYNYIYYTLGGFSENDTFRSNQIREGMISREAALRVVREENRPRYESIKWYLDIIGLEFEPTIKRINSIPKRYRSDN